MKMNDDGVITGFGVEGVRFTDYPATQTLVDAILAETKRTFGPCYTPKVTTHFDFAQGEPVNTHLPLTHDQLEYIAKTFGLERVSATKAEESPAIPPPGSLPIRDGYVLRGEWLWWRNSLGPRQVQAGNANDNWRNIDLFPEYYQWARPTFVDGKYVD